MKKFFLLFLLFLTALIPPKSVIAQKPDIVIINQIRGKEICCQAGTSDLLDALTGKNAEYKIGYGFAFRFDALENDKWLDQARRLGELGLLLEVTPELCRESRVEYSGKSDGSDWYKAKNAFLIGYPVTDRKVLIDAMMKKFKEKTGAYPKFTVSWMIDSRSLEYMSKTYGVVVHEVTKEQFETDTYTLYGGIFNHPYYPSRFHPLVPGDPGNKLEMLMMRQTVSDVVWNYGSAKAYFTSQPNDYMGFPDNGKFSYFQNLISRMTDSGDGQDFGLLGFENSYSWKEYGEEFIKQMAFVSSLHNNGEIKVFKPADYYDYFRSQNKENTPFFFQKDFQKGKSGAFWYFGSKFRTRVILKKDRMIIDDLRNYNGLVDPYKDEKAVLDYAYQVVPYLFDGSTQYDDISSPKNFRELKGNTAPDVLTDPLGLAVLYQDFRVEETAGGINISITGENNVKGYLKFTPDQIEISTNLRPFINTKNIFITEVNKDEKRNFTSGRLFPQYLKNTGNKIEAGWQVDLREIPLFDFEKQNDDFILKPKVSIPELAFLNPVFQPDRSDLPLDLSKSIFYWHNLEAVAGRNPIRLFILPRNRIGRPAKVDSFVLTPEKEGVKVSYPADYSFRISPWFIDITSQIPLSTGITVTINAEKLPENISLKFITDCRKERKSCFKTPQKLFEYFWYLFKVKAGNIINAF